MDVKGLRERVQHAVLQERSAGTLRARIVEALAAQGSDDPEQDAHTVHSFVLSYVEMAPTLMETVLAAAEAREQTESISPFLATAGTYIDERADFIPDDVGGVLGYVDDAYFVNTLMQRLSERPGVTGGLLGFDYSRCNDKMRAMLDAGVAAKIDAAVGALLAEQDIAALGETLAGVLASETPPTASDTAARAAGSVRNVPKLGLGG